MKNLHIMIANRATIEGREVIMRTLILLSVLLVSVSAQPSAQVNGYREDVQGIPVFHVWGTDFEMGYASAIGIIMLMLLLLFSFAYMRVNKEHEV